MKALNSNVSNILVVLNKKEGRKILRFPASL